MWKEAEEFLSKDKYIGPLIKKYGHCTIEPRNKRDYFSGLTREILTQQLSNASASAIRKRFETKVKGKVTPDNILKLSERDLRSCGMSWAKARYVRDLADKVKKKVVEIQKLDKLPDEKVFEELIKVKGIGRWTAEMFLMFSLGRPDVFPADDLGIRKGVQKLINNQINQGKIAKFAERWKPYRTVASWYLWASLDN